MSLCRTLALCASLDNALDGSAHAIGAAVLEAVGMNKDLNGVAPNEMNPRFLQHRSEQAMTCLVDLLKARGHDPDA